MERRTNKEIYKGIFVFAIYVAVFIFLIQYITNNQELKQRIADASVELIIVGLCLSALSVGLKAFLDVSCAKGYGIKIGRFESLGMTFISSALNLILPFQLGSAVKAIYFKKKTGLTYSRYIAITSGVMVINLVITFVQLIVCLILFGLCWNMEAGYILMMMFVLLSFAVLFLLIFRFREVIYDILPFKSYSLPIMNSFFAIFENPKMIFAVSINLLATAIAGGIRFSGIFSMLGYDRSFLIGMLYFCFYSASTVLPVLPSNIGISEVIVGIMNVVLGFDFDAGVTVVLVNRIYHYIVSIVGALVFAWPMWRHYRRV